ncbi:MAG TPA: hypothetical protein PKH10_00190 [bacterium]|nr:hypothetical protein [bacterium]
MKNCYYINSTGPDENKLKTALCLFLGKITTKKILLAVPQKDNLDGAIKNVFGEAFVKEICRNNRCGANGHEFSLMTEKKDHYNVFEGSVIAIYATQKLLDKIDSILNVTDVLVVPWVEDDISEWRPRWGATDIENGIKSQGTVLSAVVKTRLDNLHDTVNVSTGLAHPSDRDYAINMFEEMKTKGTLYNPIEVKNYLIAEKRWDPEHADQVYEIAKGIFEGKKFRKSR